jgi:hypothetical protein
MISALGVFLEIEAINWIRLCAIRKGGEDRAWRARCNVNPPIREEDPEHNRVFRKFLLDPRIIQLCHDCIIIKFGPAPEIKGQ